MASHSASLPLNLFFNFPTLRCLTGGTCEREQMNMILGNLTRGHIWILPLTAYKPNIERKGALLLHLYHDNLAAVVGRGDGDDVPGVHCGGAGL